MSVNTPDGIPNDGIPDEDIVTVHIGITVVYVTLATTGLVFAVVCLVFNLVFRQKRLAKFAAFLIQSWNLLYYNHFMQSTRVMHV